MRFVSLMVVLLAPAASFPQPSGADSTPVAGTVQIESGADTGIPSESTAGDSPGESVVVVCPIEGMIDQGIKVVVERAVREAKEVGAAAIFFRVDTPGGLVDAAVEIAEAIQQAECQTVAFIEGMGAISAGALISYACDTIVMTPGTNMGAAAPVTVTPEGMQPLGEKETSFVRAKMRALAESNGHNPAIAEAMVDKDIELRAYTDLAGKYIVYASNPGVQAAEAEAGAEDEETPVEPAAAPASDPADLTGEVILASGKLLTVTPKEAEQYGLSFATVDDLDAAIGLLVPGKTMVHEIVPNWAEATFRFLTNPTIAGLLLMLALGGLYFEIKSPGLGLPGLIAVTSLMLLFGAHYVLGLANILDLLLILTGLSLIFLEIFVIPGFGLPGISGFVFVVLGLYLALTKVTIPEYSWEYERLTDVAWTLMVGALSFVGFAIATWRLFPRTRLYRALVLGTAQDPARGFTSQTAERASSAIGLEGATTSKLRPAGKGRFDGNLYDIVSRGDFIEQDVRVRIVKADGNRYVVEPISAGRKAE